MSEGVQAGDWVGQAGGLQGLQHIQGGSKVPLRKQQLDRALCAGNLLNNLQGHPSVVPSGAALTPQAAAAV